MSYGMDEPIEGNYHILRGNLNEIEFSNDWIDFCGINQLAIGSLVAMRVEMRENCIGLFVTKIR